ncbi:dihydropteroate synthase [Stanieria sp. NIES-3757]|nr:dihydropteroate synthase [Stanieria sp. NIES-3757]
MFKVVYQNIEREFSRWTEALDYAKHLIPDCKSLFADIRIYQEKELIWIYSRSHKYPQYIGAGTYDRLARLFIVETMEEEEEKKR